MELFIQSEIDRIHRFSSLIATDTTLIMNSPISAHIKCGQDEHGILRHSLNVEEKPSMQTQIVFNFSDLPFAKNSIDYIIAPHLFEIAPHPTLTLAHMRGTLQDEGCIVVTGFNALNPLAKRYSRDLLGQSSFALISPNTLKKRLSDCGLKPIAAQYFFYDWWIPQNASTTMRKRAHWVSERWFARFAMGYIIQCQKFSAHDKPWQKLVLPLQKSMRQV